MLICSQCRFENPLSNRFCQVCGFPLPAVDPSAERTAQEEKASSERDSEAAAGESSAALAEVPADAVPMEAFATLPPAEADYHQSLREGDSAIAPGAESADAPSSADSATAPDPAKPVRASAIPEGLAEASAQSPGQGSASQGSAAQTNPAGQSAAMKDDAEPGDGTEETWEESTVWTGSDDRGDDDLPTVVLPMQLSRLDSAGASHVGRQRDHNEDNFNIQTEILTSSSLSGQRFAAKGLYILCDGMGGHSGGEVASAMVVEELKRYFAVHWQEQFPDAQTIRAAIASANKVVYDANESDDRLGSGRMGTTLVLVLIKGTQVAFAHVGDSRLYTYSRRQGLVQRTVDHEVGQLEVMRGVEPEVAYGRPESYQLTQALGPKNSDHINPGLEFMELQEDMLFLLCSDGLSDYSLVEDHVEEKVAPLLGSQAVLEQGVSDLVYLANELSGHDNITAVAIRAKVRPDSKALA